MNRRSCTQIWGVPRLRRQWSLPSLAGMLEPGWRQSQLSWLSPSPSWGARAARDACENPLSSGEHTRRVTSWTHRSGRVRRSSWIRVSGISPVLYFKSTIGRTLIRPSSSGGRASCLGGYADVGSMWRLAVWSFPLTRVAGSVSAWSSSMVRSSGNAIACWSESGAGWRTVVNASGSLGSPGSISTPTSMEPSFGVAKPAQRPSAWLSSTTSKWVVLCPLAKPYAPMGGLGSSAERYEMVGRPL